MVYGYDRFLHEPRNIYLFILFFFSTLSFPLFDQSNIYFYLTLSFSLSLFFCLRSRGGGDYLRTMWDRYFQKTILIRNKVLACIVTFKILIKPSLWKILLNKTRLVERFRSFHSRYFFFTRRARRVDVYHPFFFRNRTYISIWAKLCSKRRNILYFDTSKRSHRCSRGD